MIDGIDHFVLTVDDLDATLDFYARVLGARVEREEGRPAAVMLGRQKINVHAADHPFDPHARRPTPGAGDFCLVTSEPLGAVQRHLQNAGVAIEQGPVARTGARGAMTSLYFRDPDGNLIEISRYA